MKLYLSHFTVPLGVLLVALLPIDRSLVASESWAGTCQVEFSGTSTLGKWSGGVQTQPFTVTVADPGRLAESAVSSAVSAKASELDTRNERRNKSMKEAMKAAVYPEIKVRLASGFTMAETKPVTDSGFVRPTVIPFVVELLGKEHELVGVVKDFRTAAGEVAFSVDFSVSLKACEIETPTVLGIIRVGDTIKVSASVLLKTGPSFTST